ncbi:DUF2914 domain-containing protein [candidate division KSB1 bacterium]|nr:DUF2914 domain-containing protein [candidate division KSB1 bacterium]RQW00570.1 MAG: DUF2914 domain-containing protein [candidate division KSB1 bacterium]
MLKSLKNFKSFWILEVLLFAAGFYIVYREFVPEETKENIGEAIANVGSGKDSSSAPQDMSQTILETAVVCLDIDVEKKQPLLPKGRFSKYIDVLYCFTEISGKIPNALVHDWIYEGEVLYSQRTVLNGIDTKAWTKMSMSPEKTGTWRVNIRTDNGQLLGSADFVLK